MMRRLVLTAATTVLALAPAPMAAQRGWNPAQCELSTGHYLVNSAVLYLRNASTTRFPDQRQRDERDANRVLMQALDQGRDDDPAVWYYLGRYYVMQNDPIGADSAFDKAERLAPECASDIRVYRRNMWVPVLNRGVDALQNAQNEDAKAAFRQANALFDEEPPAFYYLAQIFATEGTNDSAVAYYRRTIEIASDSANRGAESSQNILRNSTFNTARLFHRAQQYDSAAAWYRRYRQIDPNDAQALTGLAEVLTAAGQTQLALDLYDSVLARAADLPALDVFATGVALFRAERYDRAARAFELGLEKSPAYRDALFNLANTYLSMSDDSGATAARKRELGAMMEPVVRRLLDADPANMASMRLLAASFQLRGMQDSTLAVLERAQRRPFDMTISQFQGMGNGVWELRGLITNAGEAAVQVPAITFEFLDEAGTVVTTNVIQPQTLETAAPIAFQVRGENIASWRYRLGS